MSLSFPAGTEMFQFPAFALLTLCVQVRVTEGCSAGFPHSEISGSTLVCQFPGAYRRLPRLSSPLDAKTSTMHPLELDHNYRSPSSRLVGGGLLVVGCWNNSPPATCHLQLLGLWMTPDLPVVGCALSVVFQQPTTRHLQPTSQRICNWINRSWKVSSLPP